MGNHQKIIVTTKTSSCSSSLKSDDSSALSDNTPYSTRTSLKFRARTLQLWQSIKKALKEHHQSVELAHSLHYGDPGLRRYRYATSQC